MLRIFGHFVPATTALLGVTEAFVIAFSLCLAAWLLSGTDSGYQALSGTVTFALFVAAATLAAMHSSGFYHADALVDLRRALRRGALVLILVLVLSVAMTTHIDVCQIHNP